MTDESRGIRLAAMTRLYRRENGMTLDDLSFATGVQSTTLSRFERGKGVGDSVLSDLLKFALDEVAESDREALDLPTVMGGNADRIMGMIEAHAAAVAAAEGAGPDGAPAPPPLTLESMAAELGSSRQYVHQVIRRFNQPWKSSRRGIGGAGPVVGPGAVVGPGQEEADSE